MRRAGLVCVLLLLSKRGSHINLLPAYPVGIVGDCGRVRLQRGEDELMSMTLFVSLYLQNLEGPPCVGVVVGVALNLEQEPVGQTIGRLLHASGDECGNERVRTMST